MLKAFNPRKYQLEIFQKAIKKNTLVVLPTGLGKTAIAMLIAARRLIQSPNKKIVFVAPTKPLVEQQLTSFKNTFFLQEKDFILVTGATSPEKRKVLYKNSRFIFSTPQTIENDLISNNLNLEDVSLFVFDEAHRASGNYAYVFLAETYIRQAKDPLILALTASPGANKESIDDVCKNLYIDQIEFKSTKDSSVAPYVQETKLLWKEIELTDDIKRIVQFLNNSLKTKLEKIKSYGFLNKISSNKIDLLNLQNSLHANIAKGNKSLENLHTISLLSETIKLHHALELAETQSLFALDEYLTSIFVKSKITKVKAIKNLVKDVNFLSAFSITKDLIEKKQTHPKITKLKELLKENFQKKKDSKIIIFTQYRDTATEIRKQIENDHKAEIFFGQGKRKGISFSQKQQKELIQNFSNNKFQIMIATSVAEEGLDIPSVDHVYFYEPVPSAIRSVQRRGRTGRHTKGFVTVLISKGTRDETYRWASFHKEKKMFKVLTELANKTPEKKTQKSLTEFTKETNLTIYVDHREKGSSLVKELLHENVNIKLKQLQVGDFLISSKVAVEFKNTKDFVDSILDGRLLMQLQSLIQYEKPVIVIEGDEDIYSIRNIHPSAIDGMLATIALTYRIPVFRTKTPTESARLLIAMAKKEQTDKNTTFTFHSAKPMDDQSLQEYIVSSFPNIGGVLAKNILNHFDSIESFLKASKEDLLKVPKLGETKINEIFRLKSLSYKSSKKE